MSEEQLKKLCKEEFLKNIKENIKSETIFTYIDGLEKENIKYKQVIDKIKEYINRTEINSVGKPLAYTEIGKELLELLEEIE
jgi:hypothetical protein